MAIQLEIKTTEFKKPIEGNKVRLVCPEEKDSHFLLRCYQDYNFMRLYRSWNIKKYLSEQNIKEQIIEEEKISPLQNRKIEWIIWRKDRNTKIPVGLAGLVDYRAVNKQAEFCIGLIKEHRKSGIGFEASLLIFDFSYNILELNKLISMVYGYNKEAQKNTLKLGFLQEGVLRKYHWDDHDKQLIDVYYNGLLEEEFRSNKKLSKASKRLLSRDVTQKNRSFQMQDQAKVEQIKKFFKAAYKKEENRSGEIGTISRTHQSTSVT